MKKAAGVVDALGIAGDFFAYDTERVRMVRGAPHSPNTPVFPDLHFECANTRASVGTGAHFVLASIIQPP